MIRMIRKWKAVPLERSIQKIQQKLTGEVKALCLNKMNIKQAGIGSDG